MSASVCGRRQQRMDRELCGPRYCGSHSPGDCHAFRVSVMSVARHAHARTHTHHTAMIKVSMIERRLCLSLTAALASRIWRDRWGVIDYYNRVFNVHGKRRPLVHGHSLIRDVLTGVCSWWIGDALTGFHCGSNT